MALSGCSGVNVSPKADLMVEDTLAHEEIFGDVEEAGYLGLKGPRMRASFGSDFIKMGYQINFDNKNNADDSDDTISIRFIAALKDANVKAFWHRGFAQSNGYEGVNKGSGNWEYKLEDNVYETGANALNVQSTKFYSSLTDGSNTITAKTGVYSEYEGFVIYTLRNIPYNTYKDAYLGVYLEVIDADNGEIKRNSDFAAVKVEKASNYVSANYFSIDSEAYNNKYFLQGSLHVDGENPGVESNIYVLDNDTGGNVAKKEGLRLATDDTFGVFRFKTDHFQAFGYNQLRRGAQFLPKVSGKNYIKASGTGSYNLYLTNDAENQTIHIVAPDAAKGSAKLYFKPGNDWTSYPARYALYVFNNGNSTSDWIDLEQIGSTGIYSCDEFSAVTWPNCIFCRMDKNTDENNWSNKWSQTGNLSTDDAGNIFYVNNDSGTGDGCGGNWNLYLA